MSKIGYKVKNAFKSKETIEVEAKMKFNQNKRAFKKYYDELDASIKNFSNMARDAELSGNHENARSCASFVVKLQKTQIKVQGLLQRFEMMYSMQRLTGVMTNFMKSCAEMGFNMDMNIDLKKMWKNTAEMDKALSKLDAMSDQMDTVFDTIDSGMNSNQNLIASEAETEAETDRVLDQIMGRYNALQDVPQAAAQSVQAAPQAAAAENDDIEERLRRMKQELS